MTKRARFKEFAVRCFDSTWVWIKHEFTGMRGKKKLVVTGRVLWFTLKMLVMILIGALLVFRLLLSIGDDD